MSTLDIAKKLVNFCRQGKNDQAVATLFAEDAVSVEAMAMAGGTQEVKGIAAIKGKGEWWRASHEVHSASVTGCTDKREFFTSTICDNFSSVLIAANVTGLGSASTAITSTIDQSPSDAV